MNIPLHIADNRVAMTAEQMVKVNALLADMPVLGRYDDDGKETDKRLKLEAVLTVKTSTYTAPVKI
jgi:predicted aconitase with swiveling domain